MNWQHLSAFLWLRQRLFVNELRRAGIANAVLLALLLVFIVSFSLFAFVGGFFLGLLVLADASPLVLLLVWNGVTVAFLFFWTVMTFAEAQRSEALSLNKPLATAYYMKEDLRQIWQQPNKATAKRVLDDWIRRAEESGIKILHQMAATLGVHRRGILAHYDYPISTGPLEGTNNKIKTMQRQAYGFRDHPFFKLKIYALHQTRYALVG